MASAESRPEALLNATLSQVHPFWESAVRQVNYYLSSFNLRRDQFFLHQLADNHGLIPLELMLSCNRMKRYNGLTIDKLWRILSIAKANAIDGTDTWALGVCGEAGDKNGLVHRPAIGLVAPLPNGDAELARMVRVRGLPACMSMNQAELWASQWGTIEAVHMLRTSVRGKKARFNGNLLVVFKDAETPRKLLAMADDEPAKLLEGVSNADNFRLSMARQYSNEKRRRFALITENFKDGELIGDYLQERVLELHTPQGMPPFKSMRSVYAHFSGLSEIADVDWICSGGVDYDQAFVILKQPKATELLRALPEAFKQNRQNHASARMRHISIGDRFSARVRTAEGADLLKRWMQTIMMITERQLKILDDWVTPRHAERIFADQPCPIVVHNPDAYLSASDAGVDEVAIALGKRKFDAAADDNTSHAGKAVKSDDSPSTILTNSDVV